MRASWWRDQLSACFDSVATQLPQLQSSLSQLGHSMGEWVGSLGGGPPGGDAVGQEYELGRRRLRVVRLLGEGGYSFVYLVREVQGAGNEAGSSLGADVFALKRVLCGGKGQLAEAWHEAEVMQRLRHPCLLRLLDAAASRQRAPDGSERHVALLLFPVYDAGNLFDFVQQQRQQWQRAADAPAGGGPAPPPGARARLRQAQLREGLEIFLQVCAALHAMHSCEPPLAHRDVKPHNVLLRLRQPLAAGAAGGAAGGGAGGATGTSQQGPQQQQQGQQQAQQQQERQAPWEARGWDAGAPAAAVVAVQEEGGSVLQAAAAREAWWARRLPQWQERVEAVLMDFGSTRDALITVANRSEAMSVQEDAERQCTAPYRAPELWDVPSSCTIDQSVDVWSLGCLLYFILCGESPFERAAGVAGGSLMLAVVNGRLTWPDDAASACPTTLKQLVAACLHTDPAERPSAAEAAAQADAILAALPLPQ